MSYNTIVRYNVKFEGNRMIHDVVLANGQSNSTEQVIERDSIIDLPNMSRVRNLEQLEVYGSNIADVRLNADTIMNYMDKLTDITLSDIHITGDISRLAVPNLRRLYLEYISAEDEIYNLLDALAINSTYLTELEIYGYMNVDNDEFSYIPDNISNLTDLTNLTINDSNLAGLIPNLGALRNLNYLDLAFNSLQGEIPNSIGRLSNLTVLRINNNQLTGSIPDIMRYLNNVIEVNLSMNRLSGQFPNRVVNSMTDLINLNLKDNEDIEGQINVRAKGRPLKINVENTNTYITEQYDEYLDSLQAYNKIHILFSDPDEV